MALSNGSPLWWPERPGTQVTTSYCLGLIVWESLRNSNPDKPYSTYECHEWQYPLCERLIQETNIVKNPIVTTLETMNKKRIESDRNLLNSIIMNNEGLGSCPGGFFMSSECFVPITDSGRTWTDAAAKCQAQNMKLAEPSNKVAVALRTLLLNRYGTGHFWMNAKANGSHFIWQHSNTVLSTANPLWWPGEPKIRQLTTNYCMALLTGDSTWKKNPDNPYGPWKCSSSYYTLCELEKENF
ncbi:unnamed protein product [Meganyctiphanes norvegica]|uniref:C-type lectin domain-containing protein n=1 Tax=Meganyctiphanes norvegica TaxID=48144 RepID=A0AAV2R1V3_MEGNR